MSDLERSALRAARRSGHLGVPESVGGEEDGWLITYLDVITLLLVMFVVMLALSGGPSGMPGTDETVETKTSPPVVATEDDSPAEPEVETGKDPAAEPQADPAAAFAEQASKFLREAGLSGQVDVVRQDGGVSLRIGSEVLFASGTAELSNDGMRQLEQLTPLLAQTDYRLEVAGHTDNRPIRSERYPSNWELSSARAASVVRLFLAEGIAANRMRASGYADTEPVARNDTERGRERNRRVELVLRPGVNNTES